MFSFIQEFKSSSSLWRGWSKFATKDLAEYYSIAKSVILSKSWFSLGGLLIYFYLSFCVLILFIFFLSIPFVCVYCFSAASLLQFEIAQPLLLPLVFSSMPWLLLPELFLLKVLDANPLEYLLYLIISLKIDFLMTELFLLSSFMFKIVGSSPYSSTICYC